MRLLILALISVSLTSCMVDELPPSLVCAAIGSGSTLKVKVSSSSALPSHLSLSLNRDTVSAEESCSNSSGSQVRFSADRKVAFFTLPLSSNDNEYFPNYAETPQDDYAELHLFTRASCVASQDTLVTRDNIVITWKKAADISPGCDSRAYHGASEFTYNP